jgi:hypothetical protein
MTNTTAFVIYMAVLLLVWTPVLIGTFKKGR